METQAQKILIQNALDWAALYGVIRYQPDGQITHAPFSLTPFRMEKSKLEEMTSLTAPFSEMMIRVTQNWDFLEHHLAPVAETDDFLKMLMNLKSKTNNQNHQVLVQRNDFFVTDVHFLQVELNTISASFPFLITQLLKFHQRLFQNQPALFKDLVPNNPLDAIVECFANAVKLYGINESAMLVVVQPDEGNRFDQLGLEQHLWEKYEIRTIRKTLEEIANEGSLNQGHLKLDGQTIALTYYRAGYTPDDFRNLDAVQGRRLIEESSSIQIPDLPMQLAGMKKIQQILTQAETLKQFVPEATANTFQKTFAGMFSLDETIFSEKGEIPVTDWVCEYPEKYVLKPQREGGGNNYFAEEIPEKLQELSGAERDAYILMERIPAQIHPATLMVNGQVEELNCVSEIGRFGVCFADDGQVTRNEDVGYLVRTKAENVNEGGVCAGFACLNSLRVQEK